MSVTTRIPVIVPTIEKVGDWPRTQRFLREVGPVTVRGYTLGQLAFAKKMFNRVRKNIRENGGTIGWAPLSSSYADYKSRLGKDPNNLLVLTKLYYNSITIWNKNGIYYVGVKHGIRYPDRSNGGLTVGQVAKILEVGSIARNLPARPLWGPSFRQLGGKQAIRKTLVWYIRRQIRTELNVEAKITF